MTGGGDGAWGQVAMDEDDSARVVVVIGNELGGRRRRVGGRLVHEAPGVQSDVRKECGAGAAARGFKVGESCAEVVRRYHKSAIRRRCTEAMRTESEGRGRRRHEPEGSAMARERGGGEMVSTMTRTLKGRKGEEKKIYLFIFFFLQKSYKEECFSSLSKIYEAAEEPLPPSRHPQCFSRSTGPRACVTLGLSVFSSPYVV